MKENKLIVLTKKARKHSSYQGEITEAVDNLVNRDFHADEPNKKMLTDITEFAIPAGKIYLSPIIDCFDGMVPTWKVSTKPNAKLVNQMLDDYNLSLKNNEKPLIHSGRGVHYRWPEWIEKMKNMASREVCRRKNAHQIMQHVKAFLDEKK